MIFDSLSIYLSIYLLYFTLIYYVYIHVFKSRGMESFEKSSERSRLISRCRERERCEIHERTPTQSIEKMYQERKEGKEAVEECDGEG